MLVSFTASKIAMSSWPDAMKGASPGWSFQNLKFDSVKSVITYTILDSGKSHTSCISLSACSM